MDGFLAKAGYPMCLGALDGTHFSVKHPIGLESDYYNYKKFHSIIILAVVNANLMFTYVNVGAPEDQTTPQFTAVHHCLKWYIIEYTKIISLW